MSSGFEYKRAWHRSSAHRGSAEAAGRPPLWRSITAVRVLTLAVVAGVPWYYATVEWTPQLILLTASAVVLLLAAIVSAVAVFRADTPGGRDGWSPRDFAVPLPAWLFLAIAAWGYLQAVPRYPIDGEGGPNVIQLQRYFLGEDVPAVGRVLGLPDDGMVGGARSLLPEDARSELLSWSVEPLHTRAGVGMMALVAGLIWIGSSFFGDRRGLLWLFGGLTVVGLCVSLVGLAHVLSWSGENFLGLRSGGSFGPFVSRNTGGTFVNLCLSASFGLAVIAFARGDQRGDRRYAVMATGRFEKLVAGVESFASRLTTLQIAALIACSLLLAASMATASRGAAISAAAASLAALAVSRRKKAGVGLFIMAAVVLAAGTAFLLAFELDDRIRERLEGTNWDEANTVARRLIWATAVSAASFFWATGSGLGTFQFAHLPFQSRSSEGWFYNAENLYLEAVVDLGWVGVFAIVGVLWVFVYAFWPTPGGRGGRGAGRDAARVAAAGLLVTQGIHSGVDFSLIIPACFVPAALLLGAIWGDAARRRRSGDDAGRYPAESGSRRRSSRGRSRAGRQAAGAASHAAATLPAAPLSSVASSPGSSGHGSTGSRVTTASWPVRIAAIFAWLLIGAAMASSVDALDRLGRADWMRHWTGRQMRLQPADRASAQSLFAVGIWGDDAQRLRETPDAARLVAYSLLSEHRWLHSQYLMRNADLDRARAMQLSAPIITHLALRRALAGVPESAEAAREAIIGEFFGDQTQVRRWQEATSLLQSAVAESPLDWRITYGLCLTSFQSDASAVTAAAARMERLAAHRPDLLLQLAALVHDVGSPDLANRLLRTAMRNKPSLTYRVGELLPQWYSDAEVPVAVFPDSIDHLLAAARRFNATGYERTGRELTDHAQRLVERLERVDPKRAVYAATIGELRGDDRAVVESLSEAVRRNPTDVELRVRLVDAAIRGGLFEVAAQQLEDLKFDTRAEARLGPLRQRLQEARRQAERARPDPS